MKTKKKKTKTLYIATPDEKITRVIIKLSDNILKTKLETIATPKRSAAAD